MKLLLATLLISLNTWACPNLAGSFKCIDQDSEYTLNIKQYISNGVQVYELREDNGEVETIKADDVWRDYELDPELPIAKMKASCKGSQLVQNINSDVLKGEGQTSRLANGDIQTLFKLTFMGNNMPEQLITCYKF